MAYTGAQEFQELGRQRRVDAEHHASSEAPVSWPVIDIDPTAYMTDVIHTVVFHPAAGVILVFPGGCRWSEADFETLARRCVGAQKSVVVVCHDRAVRGLARRVGLAVFNTIERANTKLASHALTLHAPRPDAPRSDALRPDAPHSPAPPLQRWPVATRRRLETLGRQAPWTRLQALRSTLTAARPPRQAVVVTTRLLIFILTVIAGAVVVGLGLAAIPTGSVTVRPATQMVETTFEVMARSGAALDARSRLMPARSVETVLEAKAEATPTGVRIEPDQRATGFVQFINRRSEPIPIPMGAVVETSGGARFRFRTTQAAILPAGVGVSLRVPIIAVEPGISGNVPANAINTLEPALALVAGVVNDTPITGGTTRESAVVTEEDRQRLRQDLRARLEAEAITALRSQLAQDERLALDSLDFQVIGERVDRDLARPDFTSLSIRLLARGLGYAPDQAGAVVDDALGRQAPQGFRLLPTRTTYVVADQERVTRDGGVATIRLWVRATGIAVANIDRQAVRHAVRGMAPSAALDKLSSNFSLAEPAWVSVGPRWVTERWNRLPWLPLRIDVVVLGEAG